MSKDSSFTYLHTHSSRLADLFEDFCRPPSSYPYPGSTASSTNPAPGSGAAGPNSANSNNPATQTSTGDPSTTQLPGHFLPFEEIHLPPHLMPVNPEDEDDVVPDMHAAFGITRALGQSGTGGGAGEAGVQREPAWRDLGMERLVEGGPKGGGRVGGRQDARRVGRMINLR